MSSIETVISDALGQYQDPVLGVDPVSADLVKNIAVENGSCSISLEMPYPTKGVAEQVRSDLQALLTALDGIEKAEVSMSHKIASSQGQNNLPTMTGVKNVIAVASGKGGVGKSTTTVNLALAMAAEGARVGILDADIYGPSQGMMLGVAEGVRPQPYDQKHFLPIEAHGIQSISMSYLIEEDTAMVWRGPMAAGALQQLLTQTYWQDLDYLFIDMPPGTGDIQLTLSQKVPVAGAVIVTTPQDIALLDAKKGIEMFRKVDIPVLGVVENMSTHTCSNCGHTEPVFGAGGGESIAERYETELLGQLPLALSIREQVDSGKPTVVAEPDSAHAQSYIKIARRLAAVLAEKNAKPASVIPNIIVEDD